MDPESPSDPAFSDDSQAAVTRLLARLPDPGPMPDDIADRVDRALEQAATVRSSDRELFDELGFVADEDAAQGARDDQAGMPGAAGRSWLAIRSGDDGNPGADGGDRHTGLWAAIESAGSDGGHRRWPVVAAAVAAVAVLGVAAVLGLTQIRRGAQGLAAVPGEDVPPFAGITHVHVSTTVYAADTLPAQARALTASTAPDASSGDAVTVGPLATSTGLNACIAALGQSGASEVDVDLATYGSDPAAVVVARTDAVSVAYVVERDCTTGDPGILHDAVNVP